MVLSVGVSRGGRQAASGGNVDMSLPRICPEFEGRRRTLSIVRATKETGESLAETALRGIAVVLQSKKVSSAWVEGKKIHN